MSVPIVLLATSLAVFLGMERSAANRQLTTTVCAISVGIPVFVVAARAAMSQAVVWHPWSREQTISVFCLSKQPVL